MVKQLRASLYFSRRRDKDIINALNFDKLEQGDINWVIKELMRDGIKYRSERNKKTIESTINQNQTPVRNIPIVESNNDDLDFDDIQLERKELSEDDILDALNSL